MRDQRNGQIPATTNESTYMYMGTWYMYLVHVPGTVHAIDFAAIYSLLFLVDGILTTNLSSMSQSETGKCHAIPPSGQTLP